MLRAPLITQAIGFSQLRQSVRTLFVSATNEAARKGTRAKAQAKKVKKEVQKVAFVPLRLRKKLNIATANKHIDDSWKQLPADNVYAGKFYKWRVYSVQEAVQCHKETHHPTVYNVPNAPLIAHIELNMQGEKVTRFVDNFSRIAMIKNKFDHGEERQILVFARGQENLEAARNAGATLVGGPEMVKDVQNGDLVLTDYQFVIAHPNVLPDLVPIRGLMKKKFPNPKSGTLGADLPDLVMRFMNGIQYTGAKDENQKDFGLVTSTIGTLDMDPVHLEENLALLLKDIDNFRPRRDGKFITRVLLKSPPSPEQFKIDPFLYVPEERIVTKKSRQLEQEEDAQADEEEDEKLNKAAN